MPEHPRWDRCSPPVQSATYEAPKIRFAVHTKRCMETYIRGRPRSIRFAELASSFSVENFASVRLLCLCVYGGGSESPASDSIFELTCICPAPSPRTSTIRAPVGSAAITLPVAANAAVDAAHPSAPVIRRAARSIAEIGGALLSWGVDAPVIVTNVRIISLQTVVAVPVGSSYSLALAPLLNRGRRSPRHPTVDLPAATSAPPLPHKHTHTHSQFFFMPTLHLEIALIHCG
ncbi:hypothetical protein ASPZODRAFT_18799 [Penicilliopsis zonata CBS 506.65]|uniref:Uncharacterized protein n=1 Tax=Penicilliopsis zonata CBS 506.65 TaxID=1073090 RepID=A0A1L9SA21_9EURO|nr:hypothetical protein ASPZODRAFT_18799 [Penicilliopsis zonata CBS 506.65]OJJ44025.1 hypothetical protein ASPZODRAFT_18799 [Penicilliopsis zonata CBS 506.65]